MSVSPRSSQLSIGRLTNRLAISILLSILPLLVHQESARALGDDYGDAPISGTSYGEALHFVTGSLKLGASIDVDSASIASATANGDGTDDDGITLPALTAGATSYEIPVGNITATNTSGTNAKLHAWVDFNKNGAFESNEYASTTVNTGTSNRNPTSGLSWSGITVGAPGNTFVRFRLTTDSSVTASTPSGTATSGEVEDYQVAIASASLSLPAAPTTACTTNWYYWQQPYPFDSSPAPARRFNPTNFGFTKVLANTWYNAPPSPIQTEFNQPFNNPLTRDRDQTGSYLSEAYYGVTYVERVPGETISLNLDDTAVATNEGHIFAAFDSDGNLLGRFPSVNRVNAGEYYIGSDLPSNVTASPHDSESITMPSKWDTTTTPFPATGEPFTFTAPANGKVYIHYILTDENLRSTPITTQNSLCPDYSDAPTSGTAPDNAGTNNYGDAIHNIVSSLKLGANIDGDSTSRASTLANGDDIDVTPDDEDGVTLPTLIPGATTYRIPAANITLTNTSGSTATLHAWVDFNKNGTFESGEYTSTTVTTGTNSGNPTAALSWTGVTIGSTGNTFARFRLTTDSAVTVATPSGKANNGEVEDYRVAIAAQTDYGDAPQDLSSIDASLNPAYPTLLANSGARHTMNGNHYLGAGVTGDVNGQPTLNADGDTEDDGVTFPTIGGSSVITVGQSNTITVNASTTGVLNGWIDWNQNGVWEVSEQIATNLAMTAGNNTITVNPANTVPQGKTYARFRFSTQSNLQPTGAASNGEVEDYAINVAIPEITSCTALLPNGGFESPIVSGSSPTPLQNLDSSKVKFYREADVPGWATISSSPSATGGGSSPSPFDQRNAIEVWSNGNSLSVLAHEGQQFAEINAYVVGRLYQDVITASGGTVRWQFAHRGRSGNDTIRVKLGVPGATISQGTYTTGNTGWQVYSGSYTVPIGQTVTRFEFEAVLSSGAVGEGNFVDNVQFGTDCATSSNPNVLLVKRITAINGSNTTVGGNSLGGYINELTNAYDDNTITIPTRPTPSDPPRDTDKWPNITSFLLGGIDGGRVKPNDVLEYTIYFLSAGDSTANKVMFCDRVPTNVTFVPRSFNTGIPAGNGGFPGSDRGIAVNLSGTLKAYSNTNDDDFASYYPPGVDPGMNCGGTNTNGAVVVNLGDLPHATTPGTAGSYGFVRFRGQVR
jgi:uncharacterized repeat protein (TIGR01451 family)